MKLMKYKVGKGAREEKARTHTYISYIKGIGKHQLSRTVSKL